jgi:hypothetical protein
MAVAQGRRWTPPLLSCGGWIMSKEDRIDWSVKCWKEMLVYQRKSLWLDDTLEKLARWLGLKPGMTAVDVGCGLGFLGYTSWR